MEVTINGEQFINKKQLQESMEINNELRDHIRALKQELDNKKVAIDWHHDMFCCPPREVFIGGVQYIRGIQCDFDLASIRREALKDNKILRDKIKELSKQNTELRHGIFTEESHKDKPAYMLCKLLLNEVRKNPDALDHVQRLGDWFVAVGKGKDNAPEWCKNIMDY